MSQEKKRQIIDLVDNPNNNKSININFMETQTTVDLKNVNTEQMMSLECSTKL